VRLQSGAAATGNAGNVSLRAGVGQAGGDVEVQTSSTTGALSLAGSESISMTTFDANKGGMTGMLSIATGSNVGLGGSGGVSIVSGDRWVFNMVNLS